MRVWRDDIEFTTLLLVDIRSPLCGLLPLDVFHHAINSELELSIAALLPLLGIIRHANQCRFLFASQLRQQPQKVMNHSQWHCLYSPILPDGGRQRPDAF